MSDGPRLSELTIEPCSKVAQELVPRDPGRNYALVSYEAAAADGVAKRLHDVRAAVRKFATVAAAMRRGYRFDDADAAGVLASLDAAIVTLEDEIDLWARAYP